MAASYASDRAAGQDTDLAGADDDIAGGFLDGGFLTGDKGYFDEGGRLVLTGRVSPSINVAGLKVDPTEIERILRALPGVADVRVMGASCDRRGQQLVAFIVSDQALTSVDIRQTMRADALASQDPAAVRLPRPAPAGRARQDGSARARSAGRRCSGVVSRSRTPIQCPSAICKDVAKHQTRSSTADFGLHAMEHPRSLQSPRCAWCRRWLISFGL